MRRGLAAIFVMSALCGVAWAFAPFTPFGDMDGDGDDETVTNAPVSAPVAIDWDLDGDIDDVFLPPEFEPWGWDTSGDEAVLICVHPDLLIPRKEYDLDGDGDTDLIVHDRGPPFVPGGPDDDA